MLELIFIFLGKRISPNTRRTQFVWIMFLGFDIAAETCKLNHLFQYAYVRVIEREQYSVYIPSSNKTHSSILTFEPNWFFRD